MSPQRVGPIMLLLEPPEAEIYTPVYASVEVVHGRVSILTVAHPEGQPLESHLSESATTKEQISQWVLDNWTTLGLATTARGNGWPAQ